MNIDKEIAKHKNELLEFSAPPNGSWQSIKKAWHKKDSYTKPWIWAAAAVLIVTVGFIGFEMGKNAQPEFSLASINPEYEPMERAYKNQIDSLSKELIPLKESDNESIKELWEEMNALDSALIPYKQDGILQIPERELIWVLTDHYEKKLRLLQRIQREMNRKNEKHETYIF